MRTVVIQCDESSPLCYLDEPAEAYGADLRHVHPLRGDKLPPDDETYDGLIVLGGAMHAEDDEEHPFLQKTMRLIRHFHRKDKPVLGVCLGAQLIARAFGAQVHRDENSECGLYSLRLTPEGAEDPLLGGQPNPVHLIEYHDDYFEMPADGVRLMESDTNSNQALRVGKTTYGIQAHFEASGELMGTWMDATRTALEKTRPGLMDRFPVEMAAHDAEARKFASDIGFGWFKMVKARSEHPAAFGVGFDFDDYY